jgi:hypothetical protein
MPFIFLTDEDHRLLKDMINDRKGGRVNSPSRSSQLFSEQDANHQAPEVYVAKTPTTGIPARSGTTLGEAACDIYRVVSAVVEAVPSFSEKVYNLQPSAVGGDTYIGIKRDKYGTWIADTGGGSANLRHGIVTKVCDTECNIYEVEIVERTFPESCTGTGT